jgi:hypothetical protein
MAFRFRFRVILGLICLAVIPALPPATADAHKVAAPEMSAPFGVVATLANRVRDDEQDAAVALLREAGVQWAREEIFWDRLQPRKGGPFLWRGNGSGFGNYDAAIDRLRRAGINILGQLDYNPAWAERPGTDDALDTWIDEWRDYVANTVRRYGRERGQIKYWEVWNEPNIRRYGYDNGLRSVGDLVRLLQVTRAAIKEADPEATIVLGGIANIWSELPTPQDYDVAAYLRLLHDAGGWGLFDILALHPYRPAPPEEAARRRDTTQDFEAEMRVVDALLAEFGPKPIWFTEVAWSSYAGFYGVSETDQAALLVRMYLLALAHPSVQRVFWYNLRDDTADGARYDRPVDDPREAEYHFGLLRRVYPLDPRRSDPRKPAFVAYRAMTQVLQGMTGDGVIGTGADPALPGIYGYRYHGPRGAAAVLWRIGKGVTPAVSVTCDCRMARVRRWDGTPVAVLQANGSLTVPLDEAGLPLYVEWGSDMATDGKVFGETGQQVSGVFLQYWTTHGGLPQFGFPITAAGVEAETGSGRPRIVQYFERQRFEFHPEHAGTPYEVLLGRLGAEALARQGRDWQGEPKANPSTPHYVAATGHAIAPQFWDYWRGHGLDLGDQGVSPRESLALFGYPITEPRPETNVDGDTVLTQWFERARFEYHPNHAEPFKVLLGRLAADLVNERGR